MPHTSVSTYARALSGNKLPHVAAGDYENKLSTKILKGILYVLTAGLAYGFTRVIEHYCNVTPKVAEFCANAGNIHNHLADAVRDGLFTIDVELSEPQALGAIPSLEHYIARASNMQEAEAQRAADIKERYRNYLDTY
ncbi:hypothetical protein E1669_07725 [Salmonella enterica subsp. enterica serovar Matopeni]|nr:hypothetical protein [Salmonella enterica subsp. enterica serovar Matopeni]ECG5933294.1 hypothetical protein [Salmonella enterica subsp. enterica serovar Matopeni]EDV3425986.1 hypothetical protein [Salmonella enterica subsp. enterica]EDV9690857.1 hypothetical protein [Salmonella enterica subsp. enterica]